MLLTQQLTPILLQVDMSMFLIGRKLPTLFVCVCVCTCPWRAPTAPAAGSGPPSGPGTPGSAAPAGPLSASTSSLRSPSRSPPSSEEQQKSMLGVCGRLHIKHRAVCVCFTWMLSVRPYSACGFSETCRRILNTLIRETGHTCVFVCVCVTHRCVSLHGLLHLCVI